MGGGYFRGVPFDTRFESAEKQHSRAHQQLPHDGIESIILQKLLRITINWG